MIKRTIPIFITFVVGVIMVGEFFIPHSAYRELTGELLDWGIILSAGAFILGLVNLIQVHLPISNIWPSPPGRHYIYRRL